MKLREAFFTIFRFSIFCAVRFPFYFHNFYPFARDRWDWGEGREWGRFSYARYKVKVISILKQKDNACNFNLIKSIKTWSVYKSINLEGNLLEKLPLSRLALQLLLVQHFPQLAVNTLRVLALLLQRCSLLLFKDKVGKLVIHSSEFNY